MILTVARLYLYLILFSEGITSYNLFIPAKQTEAYSLASLRYPHINAFDSYFSYLF